MTKGDASRTRQGGWREGRVGVDGGVHGVVVLQPVRVEVDVIGVRNDMVVGAHVTAKQQSAAAVKVVLLGRCRLSSTLSQQKESSSDSDHGVREIT